MGVTLAIDLGEKRVGIAVSDPLGILARPVTTITYRRQAELVDTLVGLVAEHAAEKVVVGLPKTLRNEIGPQAQRVLAFVDVLCRSVDVPIETWDERLTTAQASRLMSESQPRGRRGGGTMKSRRPRGDLDALAAAVLLESYLAATPRRTGAS